MKTKFLLIMFFASLLLFMSCSSNNNNALLENDSNENKQVVEKENNNIKEDIGEPDQPSDEEKPSEEPTDFTIGTGHKIPDFKMPTLEGDSIHPSDYEGKIVILNFWASWCGYCDEEMPDLEIIDNQEDVVVIAINVQEKKSVVEEYISNGGYDFITVLDEDGLFSNVFSISSLPTSYFIDKDGLLVGAVATMLTLDQMEQIVEDIRTK